MELLLPHHAIFTCQRTPHNRQFNRRSSALAHSRFNFKSTHEQVLMTIAYFAVFCVGRRISPTAPFEWESCQAGLSDANHRICDWQSRLLDFHRLVNNRIPSTISLASSFQKHYAVLKCYPVKTISSTEFNILPRLCGLSTAPQKFYRRNSGSGFNQTFSIRQYNTYIPHS